MKTEVEHIMKLYEDKIADNNSFYIAVQKASCLEDLIVRPKPIKLDTTPSKQPFIIYTAHAIGELYNCKYPNCHVIRNLRDLFLYSQYDHVCAQYKDNYRNKQNFIRSICIPMDIDNTHSENPNNWITIADIKKEFADVNFMVCPSKSYMKAKAKNPVIRPKYHVYFPLSEIFTDLAAYEKLKNMIIKYFDKFDAACSDASRFIAGNAKSSTRANPEAYHINNGNICIDQFFV